MSDAPSRYPRGPLLWGPALAFVVLGGLVLWIVPEQLLNHWVVSKDADEQRKLLGVAAQIVLFALGGVIAIIGVTLSIARHGESLKATEQDRARQTFEEKKDADRREEFQLLQTQEQTREERRITESEEQRRADRERELRSRFVSAVDLLSASASIKRTSGLYALAALADDWVVAARFDEVQVCVDVLCGYLRAAAPGLHAERLAETDVRRTGFDIMRTHLTRVDGTSPAWAGMRFSLAGAPIWFETNLTDIECGGLTALSFDDCEIAENTVVNMSGLRLVESGIVSFARATLGARAQLVIDDAHNDRGILNLSRVKIGQMAGVTLARLSMVRHGHLALESMDIGAGAGLIIDEAKIEDKSRIRANAITLQQGAVLSLARTRVQTYGEVTFDAAVVAENAQLMLNKLTVSGGEIHFRGITLEHGSVLVVDDAVV